MRRIFTGIIILFMPIFVVVPAAAVTQNTSAALPSHLLIVELQTSSATGGASEKFIKLYNPTDSKVDVTGWQVQYRSAAKQNESDWKTKATIACVDSADSCRVTMGAHEWLLLSSYDAAAQQLQVSSAFATTGGQIRLINSESTTQDVLTYGNAIATAGNSPAKAPGKGESLIRKIGQDSTFVDTGVNANDFAIGCDAPDPLAQPTELAATPAACPQAQTVENAPGADSEAVAQTVYLPVLISELFPDPASPQTDSADEFIELFNPNGESVDLTDYQLQSGSNYRYKYSLQDSVIGPGEYLAIMSGESHLSLTNTGTSVRLLDPAGNVIDVVASYGKAKTGQSWMKSDDGMWQWTTSPTPGGPNVLVQSAGKVLAASTKKSSTKKSTSSASKSKASLPKVATPVAAAATAQPVSGDPNMWLLGGIGVLVAGYALFEYRQEIGTGLSRLRAKFAK